MRAPPEVIHNEFQRRTLIVKIEAAEAALATARRRSQSGPTPRDPLLESQRLATEIPLPGVASYLRDSLDAFEGNQWEDCVTRKGLRTVGV